MIPFIKKLFGLSEKPAEETKKPVTETPPPAKKEPSRRRREADVREESDSAKKLKESRPPRPAVLKDGGRVFGADVHGIDYSLVSPSAAKAVRILNYAGFDAFIVGGAVRDLLLGIRPHDFDIATNATPEEVKGLFRRAFLIGRRFRIVHVILSGELLEVTTFRGNSDDAPTDSDGRILQDNTYGSQAEDAARRDLTVNAMYYDPVTEEIIDYHGGIGDLKNKRLRIIGDAEQRFREDPVRILRLLRFAAHLGFSIVDKSAEPIARLAPLVSHVPPSRLFDEVLKILMSGSSLAGIEELRRFGLDRTLMPFLDTAMKRDDFAAFINTALSKTDERISMDKTVSPGFLFATLLWPQVEELSLKYRAEQNEPPTQSLFLAAHDIMDAQLKDLSVHKRIFSDMLDIWLMQPRFEKRTGAAPFRLFESKRFRAGYDFLLIRCETGFADEELGNWWRAFAEAKDNKEREALVKSVVPDGSSPARRRRRRRKPKPQEPAQA